MEAESVLESWTMNGEHCSNRNDGVLDIKTANCLSLSFSRGESNYRSENKSITTMLLLPMVQVPFFFFGARRAGGRGRESVNDQLESLPHPAAIVQYGLQNGLRAYLPGGRAYDDSVSKQLQDLLCRVSPTTGHLLFRTHGKVAAGLVRKHLHVRLRCDPPLQ